jgi:hypothetical protein
MDYFSYIYERDQISDIDLDIINEASADSHIILENLYPRIEAVLSKPEGDRKFKHLVGQYMDRNNDKLHTSGPVYLIPFAADDKMAFFDLFGFDYVVKGSIKERKVIVADIDKMVLDITKQLGSTSDFKLLRGNPIFWVFYCCIRYYHIKKDQKGLNTALAIYALSNYPAVFSTFFKFGADEGVMQYTIDNLTDKFIIKQQGNIFNALFVSIQHSYDFLKAFMIDASDKEIIRFIQRIRNDQKSMIKKICDKYMQNHAKGLRVSLTQDAYDGMQTDVDGQNKTSTVEIVARKISIKILTQDINLKLTSMVAKISGVSISECRFYISKIISDKYSEDITNFISSILFLYLYDENKKPEDINSRYFLHWSEETFRKTNSNNDNIRNIKETLDKWAEETGVHEKYKREASRVSYKKAIYFYFIFSIQSYNN